MKRVVYCDHGYPEEEDNNGKPLCPKCWALEEVRGDQREQRRYEIARDVIVGLLSTTDMDRQCTWESLSTDAIRAADALLAALEKK